MSAENGRPATYEDIEWLDVLLLSAVVLICIMACVILGVMALQAPQAVASAYGPTPTIKPAPTPTYSPAPTSMPRPTLAPATASLPTAPPLPTPTATRVVPGEPALATSLGSKWIYLDLSEQRLTAYEGNTPVFSAVVSTGVRGMPTPVGDFRILRKVRVQPMGGPDYYLPNVEWVAYFHNGYALHGTYWHDNFGHPMSHGCVNLTNPDAKWIYEWAPTGTPVQVRD